MTYLETARRLAAEGPPFDQGSAAERAAVDRFRALLSDFKAPDFRERVRDVYAEETFFDDTLKTIRDAAEVERYLAASADAVEVGTVEFLDLVVSNGDYYFRWEMTLEFKKIAKGETHRSVGMTHVRFDRDGKVVLHKDFWDSTNGLFEHVPGLGWALRRAKARL